MPISLSELELKLQSAKSRAAKLTALNELADFLGDIEPRRAIAYAEEAMQLAGALGNQDAAIEAQLNRSWANFALSNFALSATDALEALKQAQEQQFQLRIGEAHSLLGTNHEVVGNSDAALAAYRAAFQIYEHNDNRRHMSSLLNNIGALYSKAGNHEEALKHLQAGLQLAREVDAGDSAIGTRLVNMAQTYNRMGLYAEAIEYAMQSLLCFEHENDTMGMAYALSSLGTANRYLHNYRDARMHYQQGLAAARNAGARHEEAVIYRLLAELYIEQEKPDVAISWLEKALTLFYALGTKPDIFETHDWFSRAYKMLGDFERALFHYEQFHTVKEQVINEHSDSRLKAQQAMYEVESAQLEAQTQQQRAILLQREIEQNEQMIADLDAYADHVAHDLKNPTLLVTGFAELLLESNRLDAKERDYLRKIHASGSKIAQIIEALLSLAKTRKEEVSPHPVNIDLLVAEAWKRLHPLHDRLHDTLSVVTPLPRALGHAPWLEEIWANYISNALKYGGNPTHITIGAESLPDGYIRYWVKDNGAGIKPELQARLFRDFERLGKKNVEGHGLGLSLVKTIVEKLGGTVGVMSSGKPGEGAIFWFTLRAAEEAEPVT
jgi:signal transduction histidine kinase